MIDEKQISEFVISAAKDIAALYESSKSAHKRIDQMDELAASVHELAREVGRIAEKVEQIAERMDKTILRIEQGQKDQGIRIGNIEKSLLPVSRNEKAIETHERRLDEIDKAPGEKWNRLLWLIFSAGIGAVVTFIAGRALG